MCPWVTSTADLERGGDRPVDREQADEGPEQQRGVDQHTADNRASRLRPANRTGRVGRIDATRHCQVLSAARHVNRRIQRLTNSRTARMNTMIMTR